MSTEHRPDESELWEKIKSATGLEKADALVDLSHIAYDRGDFQEALAFCESARDIFVELGENVHSSRLAHVYDGMMWCHTKLDRKVESAQDAEVAAELLVDDEPVKYSEALRTAGCHWYSAKNYEKSYEFHKKALELAYVEKTEYDSAIDNHNIGMCLQKMDKHGEAIEYFLKARELAKVAKKPENVAGSDFLLADSYIKLGNGVEALVHAQKSLDFAEISHDRSSQAWSLYALGEAKALLGDVDGALEDFKEGRGIATHLQNPDWELVIQLDHEIADVLEGRGEGEEAARIRARIATLEETMGDGDEKSEGVDA